MTSAPQPVSRGPRRNTWLRVLVLLLALLVPGAHAEAHAGPTAAVSGESTTVECDVLDSALRPPVRGSRRTAVPPSPAPLRTPGPASPAHRSGPVPPSPPYDPRPLRSEVLRC
ncbi:hypothetical protein QNO09_24105 [Streptomyces sp. 378]|uniref:hypothetical protein n=1 Tax=Streptomyces sp. 378 TaxID=3049412 RepID=UPI0024C4659F|nr:hypothetical protein [Streptomyces sp. 378]MDK1346334.1 hypothetical protein [Streptomyces sp. 378]